VPGWLRRVTLTHFIAVPLGVTESAPAWIQIFKNLFDQNIEIIRDLCTKHKVSRLFVFGSILSRKFKKNSDIDLLVDFRDIDLYDYADNYFDLKESLENLFKRDVDLLEDKAIKNPYLRQSIDASKQLIYGQ
jgi:predicted nucleotidyltransferase